MTTKIPHWILSISLSYETTSIVVYPIRILRFMLLSFIRLVHSAIQQNAVDKTVASLTDEACQLATLCRISKKASKWAVNTTLRSCGSGNTSKTQLIGRHPLLE